MSTFFHSDNTGLQNSTFCVPIHKCYTYFYTNLESLDTKIHIFFLINSYVKNMASTKNMTLS